jgi:hypothetical protein
LDEKCKKLEETIQRIAINTISYTRKQSNKEWFDGGMCNGERGKERCQRASHPKQTRRVKNAYKLARTKEWRLFRNKARQLGEKSLIEIERHRSSQNSRKFYKRLNDVGRLFEPQVAMWGTIDHQSQVLARWKEHFEVYLNKGSKLEQPTRPVDLRDDGVDIDLAIREGIEGALKYLKNNKAAGADSIAAELLKNAGPNLVDALHAVIQQAWTGETLPRSWNEGVLCPVYKKGDKLDCKNYRGICLLNYTTAFYPTLTRPFSIIRMGSNQVLGFYRILLLFYFS